MRTDEKKPEGVENLSGCCLPPWMGLFNYCFNAEAWWLTGGMTRLTGWQACWLARRAEYSLVSVSRGTIARRSKWQSNQGMTQSGRLKSIRGKKKIKINRRVDGKHGSAVSHEIKRHGKWGGSESGSDRDSKRCLIKNGSFSCHHQERLSACCFCEWDEKTRGSLAWQPHIKVCWDRRLQK